MVVAISTEVWNSRCTPHWINQPEISHHGNGYSLCMVLPSLVVGISNKECTWTWCNSCSEVFQQKLGLVFFTYLVNGHADEVNKPNLHLWQFILFSSVHHSLQQSNHILRLFFTYRPPYDQNNETSTGRNIKGCLVAEGKLEIHPAK